MKKIIFIFLVFFSIYAFPQDPPIIGGELVIYFIDEPANWDLIVKIDALGTVWDKDHYLTTSYEGGEKEYDESGVDHHSSDFCWDDQGFEPVLGLGHYKISIWSDDEIELANVKLDLRTSDLPDAASGGNIDVPLDYSIQNNKFYHHLGQVDITGDDLKIWELKTFVDQIITDLEPYPVENIAVAGYLGNPKVTWSQSSSTQDNVTQYKIYRHLNTGQQQIGPFYLEGTVNSTTFEYVDTELDLGRNWRAYYVVTADNGGFESVNSDTVDIQVSGFSKEYTLEDRNTIIPVTNRLNQNYPNPFNPATIINYSIKSDGFVKLTVYDVLGKEVALLVNKNLPSGKHQVAFDGSNLQSGVYFYEISTTNFRDVKKLLLLK